MRPAMRRWQKAKALLWQAWQLKMLEMHIYNSEPSKSSMSKQSLPLGMHAERLHQICERAQRLL